MFTMNIIRIIQSMDPLVCAICGDKSSGLHYGIYTCEGWVPFRLRDFHHRTFRHTLALGMCSCFIWSAPILLSSFPFTVRSLSLLVSFSFLFHQISKSPLSSLPCVALPLYLCPHFTFFILPFFLSALFHLTFPRTISLDFINRLPALRNSFPFSLPSLSLPTFTVPYWPCKCKIENWEMRNGQGFSQEISLFLRLSHVPRLSLFYPYLSLSFILQIQTHQS